ncbi:thermonuclease family protein [Saccharobesus litoralis]|uniref:thermonuclease family protein n=1 Tax=Saccharobesus litoralis TaxID=2172099 RepID=UPI00131F2BBE|nr:thermonuclease family protein [Saccharobesus litoralis]
MKPLFIALSLSLLSTYATAHSCQPKNFEQTERVQQVIDGDTIRLQDGNKIRLIGIDAPEIDYKSTKNSEPFAHQAKQQLEQLIGPSKTVKLVYDKDIIDVYNRMLAHIHNEKGQNLQAAMLDKGLAKQIVIGKNDKFWRCYREHETAARNAQRGIWTDKFWQPKVVADHTLNSKRYHEYIGQISNVWTDEDNTTWIVLNRALYIGVKQNQRNIHRLYELNRSWVGGKAIVKGKPYHHKGRWRINLTHPYQIMMPGELAILPKPQEK